MTDQDILQIIEEKLKPLSEIRDLLVALRGYNGYPGLIKDFAELKEEFWKHIEDDRKYLTKEDKNDILKTIKEAIIETNKACDENEKAIGSVEDKVTSLEGVPGKNALRWFRGIVMAVIGAAAVAFCTLWIDGKSIGTSHHQGTITAPVTPIAP